jgi:hypothetical protein
MKRTLPFFASALLCQFVNAQDTATFKKKAQALITDKFPITRTFDIQYLQYLPSDFDSELYGQHYSKADIKNHYKLRVTANIPLLSGKKWSITGSLNYRYEALEFENVKTPPNFADAGIDNSKHEFHYFSGAMSFTYFSQLFHKPVIYNASIIADGSEKDIERLKGFAGATMFLKRTQRTLIGVGFLVFIDPAMQLPVVPTVAITQRFKNSPWSIDLILPQRLFLKRELFGNGRFSIGTELGNDNFYTYPASSLFNSKVYNYAHLELKSGITYEHKLNRLVIVTFKTGIAHVVSSRASARGESSNKYVLSTSPAPTGYFSLGLSFNPWLKKKTP